MKEELLESPAFKTIHRTMMGMGPFSDNPKFDEAYVTLRLLGLDPDEAQQAIWEEMRRRGVNVSFKY